MHQMSIPAEVSPREVARKATFGGAIELCAEIGGRGPKEVQSDLKLDKAQWSRWVSGAEGVVVPKLFAVMDYCGNDAPLLWLNHARGWDIARMARYENEIERQNRLLREENAALRRVLQGGAAA